MKNILQSDSERFNIILVDDDSDDRMLFEEVFSELKLKSKLLTFKNGLEAINYFERADTAVPHVIFLDLNMPIMGGLEVLEILRRTEKYKFVPIAIYSTSSAEKDIEETLVSGANIYITKPNDYDKLKDVMNSVLKMQWQYHNSSLSISTFVMVY